MVHEQLRHFFNGFRRDAHPMAIMCGVVGALSAFYHDSLDIADEQQPPDRRLPPDRQNAHSGGHELQVLHRPALSCTRTTAWVTPETSCI